MAANPNDKAKIVSRNDDDLLSSNADHPGMVITNNKFNGDNYRSWSKAVRMGLGAKRKIGFIDGTTKKIEGSEDDSENWTRCDYMVQCWILNSLNPDIAACFMFTKSAHELWNELAEHFGEANGSLIFHLHKSLSNMEQGDDSIAVYYSKLRMTWDEIQSVDSIPVCSCKAKAACECNLEKKLQEREDIIRFLVFLMGLKPIYNDTIKQLLSIEPLPTINRAYYVLQQVEKQQQLSDGVNTSMDAAASHASKLSSVKRTEVPNSTKKESRKQKDERYCDHCKIKGHSSDLCFKIYGYPDWYKSKFGNKIAGQASASTSSMDDALFNLVDTPLHGIDSAARDKALSQNNLVSTICQEVLKALKDKGTISTESLAGPFS